MAVTKASVKAPAKPVVPVDIGECADKLYALKAQREELNRQAKAIEEHESLIKEYVINNMSKASTGQSGKVAHVRIKPKVMPTVEDWTIFYDHVRKTKSFHLLQRRLSEKAVSEQWEAGKKVPGVGEFQVISVSVTKL